MDGHPVAGVQIGPDLGRLTGTFAPPYARRASETGPHLLVEGYGCDPTHVWLWLRPVLSVRTAELLLIMNERPGVEIAIYARVCLGDSGGALWNEHGQLVGIITAKASDAAHAEVLAFATPARW